MRILFPSEYFTTVEAQILIFNSKKLFAQPILRFKNCERFGQVGNAHVWSGYDTLFKCNIIITYMLQLFQTGTIFGWVRTLSASAFGYAFHRPELCHSNDL